MSPQQSEVIYVIFYWRPDMFKKAGNIIIIVLLLIATGGIPFTRHYCGSTVMAFSVFSIPEPCCDNHCDKCHNVFKYSRLDVEYEAGIIHGIQAHLSSHTLQPAFFTEVSKFFLSPSIFPSFSQRADLIFNVLLSPASLGVFRC